MTLDETRMLEIVFITYILAMISLAICIWLWSEFRDLKESLKSRKTNYKVIPPKPPVKSVKKGHWD